MWYHKVLYDQWKAGNQATATGLEIWREHRIKGFEWDYICFQSFCLVPYHKMITLQFCIVTDVKPAGVTTLSGTTVPKKILKMTSSNQVCVPQHSFPYSLCSTSGFDSTSHSHMVSLEYSATQQKLKTWSYW